MAVNVVHTDTGFDGTAQTTYTFSSKAIGTASADRYVVVGIHGRDSATNFSVNSVTIAGVSATIITGSATASSPSPAFAVFYAALVTSGTTGDVVVTWSEAINEHCCISVWAVTGWDADFTPASVAADASAEPFDATMDCAANGAIIAYSVIYNTAPSDYTATWTGVTEDFESVTTDSGIDVNQSGASLEFATTQSGLAIQCNWSGSTGTHRGIAFALSPSANAIPAFMANYRRRRESDN